MLPQSELSLVKLLADVALVRLFFEVNQSEVTFGVAEVSEGSSTGQTFSAKLVNLGHAVPRCQRWNKTKTIRVLIGSLFWNDHWIKHFLGYSVSPLHVSVSISRVLVLRSADVALLHDDSPEVNLAVVTFGLIQVAEGLETDQTLPLAVGKLTNSELERIFFRKIWIFFRETLIVFIVHSCKTKSSSKPTHSIVWGLMKYVKQSPIEFSMTVPLIDN